MPEMSDEQIRKVLAEMGVIRKFPCEHCVNNYFDKGLTQHEECESCKALRLLAELWVATGKIEKRALVIQNMTHRNDLDGIMANAMGIQAIAREARKVK